MFPGYVFRASGEEDFPSVLPDTGMVAILVRGPEPFEQIFITLITGG